MGIGIPNKYVIDNEKIISILKGISKKRANGLILQDFREVGGHLLVTFTSNKKIGDGHFYSLNFLDVINRAFEPEYMFLLDPIIDYNVDSRGRFILNCYVPRYALKFK